MSQVALFKRLKTAGAWLAWIGAELARSFRDEPRLPKGMRIRAVDSTTVQGPASKGTEWRVHYSLDLATLSCDWFELTDQHGAELLERTPMAKGDVILGDRNYLRSEGVKAANAAEAYVLVRLKWRHSAMLDPEGKRFRALSHASDLKVGQIGQWPVQLVTEDGTMIPGRVIVTKLPAPLAAKAERRTLTSSTRKSKTPDPRSIEAAHFVMLFTTLPEKLLTAPNVLELYRYRWQIELAFKRHKQLLQLGRLPHKDPLAAQSWIHAKLVVALLLERLYRNAGSFSPWGYSFARLEPRIVAP
jgi:IS4 transposase